MTQAYKEKHRPQFHFTPKEKWMNDPNGMVYFNEEYHLFYQYHPYGTTWGPMHWGHAVSRDMIHWEHLPIALYPDELGAIFSGSAVVDWNNTTGFFDQGQQGLVAIYTSAGTYPDSERPLQQQSLAYSKDSGRTWIKYEGNPVLSDIDITDFRDPKVFWHEETNKWVMVLATGQTITIYTSLNLKEWEFASEFGHAAGSHDGVWECPDLFNLPVDGREDKWVLIVSIGDNGQSVEGSRTQYFIGHFDGTTFVNDHDDATILWLDYGRDNYAGVSWSDIQDGRRIYLGWMSNWRYANQVPTEAWRSAMTIPRELSLASTEDGIRLFQKPVAEISTIRKEMKIYTEEAGNIPLSSSLMEINIEFEKESSNQFGFVIKHSEEEKTVIGYDVLEEKLFVDRTLSGDSSFSTSFPAIQEAPLKLDQQRLKLQAFLDTSSIEVFAKNGEVAITNLLFPSEGSKELLFFSNEGTTKVLNLTLTELDSIWR
ncbi:glycoside hydrolase family 32 protein [Neobacillus niacini]|uniref:glycoside hydrolase family 32 protein n=1 Tax=Neobacillus niacini TaxID=86668 RepID=UPI002FFF05E4